jgi:hypothetical protein
MLEFKMPDVRTQRDQVDMPSVDDDGRQVVFQNMTGPDSKDRRPGKGSTQTQSRFPQLDGSRMSQSGASPRRKSVHRALTLKRGEEKRYTDSILR